MIFLSSTLLLLLVPSLLAQAGDNLPECGSCCPPVPDPVPATTACDTLDSYMDMMDKALLEGNCEGLAELEQPDEVCHAITMKAIPPCMLEEGTDERAECLAEAAEDIEEEMSGGDESGADIVASCKCDAFKNIQKSLTTVRAMMCPPGRGGRNYYSSGYGYDATTIWFQYTMCQDDAILGAPLNLACWLFTSNWNQGDFGQYYLYDNLLGDDGLDGDNVLPLLLLGGGLGGGSYGGLGGGYGGHGMQRYRREAEECEGDDCPDKKRRDANDCPTGKYWNAEAGECVASKKRRDACPSGEYDDAGKCVGNKKRRDANDCPTGKYWNDDVKQCVASKKRRDACPSGEYDDAGRCVGNKKRRDAIDCPTGKYWDAEAKKCVASRKRRETCPTGKYWSAEAKKCVASKKRREANCPSEIYDDSGNCVHSMTRRSDDVVCEIIVGEEDKCI